MTKCLAPNVLGRSTSSLKLAILECGLFFVVEEQSLWNFYLQFLMWATEQQRAQFTTTACLFQSTELPLKINGEPLLQVICNLMCCEILNCILAHKLIFHLCQLFTSLLQKVLLKKEFMTSGSFEWSRPFIFSGQNFVYISRLTQACCMPRPSSLTWSS